MDESIVSPKRCSVCGEEKPATAEFFYLSKDGKFKSACKECERKQGRERYAKDPQKKLLKNREWFEKHPDKRDEYTRRWRENNPERVKETQRQYRLKNRDGINANLREYHYTNREWQNLKRRERYYNNITEERARHKRYRIENKETVSRREAEYRAKHRDWINEKRRADYHARPEKYKAIREANKDQQRQRSRENYLKNRDRVLERTRERDRKNPKYRIIAVERRIARKRSMPDTWTQEQWETALNYWDYKCAICGRQRDFWNVIAADHWIPITSPNCPGTTHLNIVPLCHSRKDGENGCNNRKSNRDPVEFVTTLLGQRKAKKKLAEIEAFFKWMYDKYTSEGDAE